MVIQSVGWQKANRRLIVMFTGFSTSSNQLRVERQVLIPMLIVKIRVCFNQWANTRMYRKDFTRQQDIHVRLLVQTRL